jgi:hypothetical protein
MSGILPILVSLIEDAEYYCGDEEYHGSCAFLFLFLFIVDWFQDLGDAILRADNHRVLSRFDNRQDQVRPARTAIGSSCAAPGDNRIHRF